MTYLLSTTFSNSSLQCGLEVRTTKTNTEVGAHATSKHSSCTFEVCFPGVSSPATLAAEAAEAAKAPAAGAKAGAAQPKSGAAAGGKKKKKDEDLSFLDASL